MGEKRIREFGRFYNENQIYNISVVNISLAYNSFNISAEPMTNSGHIINAKLL